MPVDGRWVWRVFDPTVSDGAVVIAGTSWGAGTLAHGEAPTRRAAERRAERAARREWERREWQRQADEAANRPRVWEVWTR